MPLAPNCDVWCYIRADLVPQWQPIDTAPRDTMKSILLHTSEGDQIGWWCDGEDEWLTDDGKLLWAEPTHWMPLPNPPTANTPSR